MKKLVWKWFYSRRPFFVYKRQIPKNWQFPLNYESNRGNSKKKMLWYKHGSETSRPFTDRPTNQLTHWPMDSWPHTEISLLSVGWSIGCWSDVWLVWYNFLKGEKLQFNTPIRSLVSLWITCITYSSLNDIVLYLLNFVHQTEQICHSWHQHNLVYPLPHFWRRHVHRLCECCD